MTPRIQRVGIVVAVAATFLASVTGGAFAPAGASLTSPALTYPLGAARRCPEGWVKKTARARVEGVFERFVACAIASAAASRRLPILPPSPTPLPAGSVGISDNWSGYVEVSDGPFTSVSAQWRVPKVSCVGLSQTAEVDTWVGLGGVGVNQLFQSGTTTSCSRDQPSYAWWTDDTHGYYPRSIISVRPGDVIFSRDWQISPGLWQFVVADLTTGKRITSRKGIAWSGPSTTAEWITENAPTSVNDPSLPRGLANYGTTTFVDPLATPATPSPKYLPFDVGALTGPLISLTTPIVPLGIHTVFSTIYSAP